MALIRNPFDPVYPTDVFILEPGTVSSYHFARREGQWQLEAARSEDLDPEGWVDQPLGRLPASPETLASAVEAARRQAGGRLNRANLVVPDSWIRFFVVDTGDSGNKPADVDRLISWKLKKLLPFRPEEFRYVWAPLSGGGRRHVVIGMLERVAAALEKAFDVNGVWLGSIETRLFSLARLGDRVAPVDGFLLLVGDDAGFQILHQAGGMPRLYRAKAYPSPDPDDRAGLVRRELKLTRAFLQETGTVPRSLRTWTVPEAPGAPLDEMAREIEAFEVHPLEMPAEVVSGAGLPADLAARAPVACGTFLGRGRG